MDAVYTFGHSVDVDGDEWIDLGPPCQAPKSQGVVLKDDDEKHNPFSAQVTSKVQVDVLSDPVGTSEPVAEPDSKQADIEGQLQNKAKAIPPAPVAVSQATRSKEALVAFYLGRAKQMEAKHKKIAVPPTTSVVIRSLQ